MPGVIPHLIAAGAMFVVGRFAFKSYFDNNHREQMILAVGCVFFTGISDFFAIIFHLSNFFSDVLNINRLLQPALWMWLNELMRYIFFPAAIIGLIASFVIETKRKPIWIMGMLCIILHIIMDTFIQESGVWI